MSLILGEFWAWMEGMEIAGESVFGGDGAVGHLEAAVGEVG